MRPYSFGTYAGVRDKIIQAVLVALLLWVGAQMLHIDILSERLSGMGEEQKQHQRALEGLLDLHLRPAD